MDDDRKQNIINIHKFPFHNLKTLNTFEEDKIRYYIYYLAQLIESKEFYANTNNCLDSTLDFIITHAHFYIKKDDSEILNLLMKLCDHVFYRMKEILKEDEYVSFVDFGRVFDLLGKLMESSQGRGMKILGGSIVVNVLEMREFDYTLLTRFTSTILRIINLLNSQEFSMELARLYTAILRFQISDAIFCHIKKWVEEMVPVYLQQSTSVTETLALLRLLKVYYKERTSHNDLDNNITVTNFKGFLPLLCHYMQETDFRITAEEVLETVVYNLHYKNFYQLHRRNVFEEIQKLPNHLQQWPFIDTGVFFVIAYLEIANNGVSNLIVHLKKDDNLNKSILRAMPLLCNQPKIISCIIQIHPDVSQMPQDFTLQTISLISVSMTFFTVDIAIQSACTYLIKLIEIAGYQSKILDPFEQFPACIRFLCITSCSRNDNTAIDALRLLTRLIHIQILHKTASLNSVEIEFAKVLHSKNTQRLLYGLKLLQLILQHTNLLVLVNKQYFLELYHQIHALTRSDISSNAFYVLQLLSHIQPNLLFSMATPICVQIVCRNGLDIKHHRFFMNFLVSWLQCVTKHWYVAVPVADLRHFLQKCLSDNKNYLQVMVLLNEYDRQRSTHCFSNCNTYID